MKKIEKYLDGGMTEQQTENLTRHLLRNKFDKENRNRWKQMLKEEYQIDRSGGGDNKQAKLFRLGPSILSIAAGVLLLIGAFGIYQLVQPASPSELVAQHLEQDNLTYNVVRKDTASRPLFRQKFSEAYNQADYTLAVQLGEEMLQNETANTDDYFFLGLAYLYLKDYTSAINYLENARGMIGNKGRFLDEMNWFLSLTYTQNQDWDKAEALLQEIVKGNAWRSSEALELLKTIPKQ